MPSQEKVLSNTLAQVAGKVVNIIASLIVVKLVTLIGKEIYDQYLTAYEFLAFFGVIADMGLFAIAVRYMAKAPEKTAYYLGNILSLRLILVAGVTVLAGVIAQAVPGYPPLVKHGIWITGLSMALTIIAGTLSSVLQSRMKIGYFSLSLAIGKVTLAGLIALLMMHQNWFSGPSLFYSLLWAGVASNALFCTLTYLFTRRYTPIKLRADKAFWREVLTVAAPFGLALVLETLYLRLDTVLISVLLGVGAAGTYGIAARVLESLRVMGIFFAQAMLPRLTVKAEKGEDGAAFAWGAEKILAFMAPIIIGMVAYSEPIIRLISTEDFLSKTLGQGSDLILRVLVITVLFSGLNQLMINALVARNQQRYLLKINGAALGLNAILNLIFLPIFGIIAAAATTIFSELLVAFSLFRRVKTTLKPTFHRRNLLGIFAASLVLIGVILIPQIRESLLFGAAFGAMIYLTTLWAIAPGVLRWREKLTTE